MGYNFGGEKNGFTVSASGSQSKFREKGNGTDWTESVVEAGNKVTIVTGNDANIIAGQVKGEQVTADIGHNLNIESKQDSDQYHQKSNSKSVGGSFSTGGAPTLNASNSQTKMDSNWKSVTDQSGIFAGKGGYDIKVGNHTDLKGAVIASEAMDTSKNKLDTGTISFSDIENKADYKVSSSNMGVNTSGMPTPPNNYNKNDKASSTTHSAVSNGTLIVRNEDEQKQDINTLSRDTEHASKELKHIFNKDKEQSIIDQTQLVSEIGGQTLTMLNNIDKITATAKANEALDKERQKAQSEKTVLTEKQQQEIYKKAYEDAMNNGLSAMGSDTRQGVEMAVSIVKGLITGDMTGATAGALAPKLATIIKEKTGHYDAEKKEWKTDNVVANTVAHAILGAVVAELQGNSALAGGLGAAYGERSTEIIANILYPDKAIDKLSQEERQQVSALAQLAAGLTTAALGGDAQDINTAMAGGKNAIENNGLANRVIKGIPIGIPGINNDKTNEEIALAIERALKNIGKSINDFINDKGEIDIEEVKAVLSPEEQKILNEKIEIATNTRPKINNINDYLKNNEFGQLLSKGLVFLGYDIHGDPIFKMEGAGAGNFVNEGDKISFRKDGIEVYDKNGTLISVLNIDGTRNTTLSDMASGRYLATMADKVIQNPGYPILEPLPPIPGYVPPDKLGPNDTGSDQIPKPSEPLPGYQPLDPEQLGPNHTGGDQLVDKDWRDNVHTSENKNTEDNSWYIPEDIISRFPEEWGGRTNKKGEGVRWEDPKDKGNGVRIDRGNPNVSQPTQQEDHVIVRHNGRVIGRDGKPIEGSIADNAEKHISL